jgi:hypothetical protein
MSQEQDIQKSIIEWLRYKGFYCQRIQSGGKLTSSRNRFGVQKQYMIKLCDEGTPDIFACIKGFFVAIEVKKDRQAALDMQKHMSHFIRNGNKFTSYNKRSVNQIHAAEDIRKAGGIALVVWSIEGLEELLQQLKLI